MVASVALLNQFAFNVDLNLPITGPPILARKIVEMGSDFPFPVMITTILTEMAAVLTAKLKLTILVMEDLQIPKISAQKISLQ